MLQELKAEQEAESNKWRQMYETCLNKISAADQALEKSLGETKNDPDNYKNVVNNHREYMKKFKFELKWIEIEGQLRIDTKKTLCNKIMEKFENLCGMTQPNNDVEMKNIEKPATTDSFKESNAYKEITQSIISVSKIMENFDSDGYSNKHKNLEKMYEKSQCEVLKTFFSNEINYIICVNYMNLIFNEFASSCAIATTENIIFAVKRENAEGENLSDENRKRVETKILFKVN
uniref:Uncharacterized protein n=1 Tax=Strongyloides papillosus TaxID=174720 RepID=A0A0N5C6X2_STREA